MGDFFIGWRRKMGCVTLLLAGAFMGAWIRSLTTADCLRFGAGYRQQGITLLNGELCWWGWETDVVAFEFLPDFWAFTDAVEHEQDSRKRIESTAFREWVIPYWSIDMPLTLLSAYLLLWKPRPSLPPKTAEAD